MGFQNRYISNTGMVANMSLMLYGIREKHHILKEINAFREKISKNLKVEEKKVEVAIWLFISLLKPARKSNSC